jgi:hypothetical protein
MSTTLPPGLLNWVRDWQAPLSIRCGGYDPPPFPPFDVSLYPFTTLTKLCFQGYPNYRDKRLEANLSLGPQGWYLGYEDGEFVAARRFTVGRKMRFELGLSVMNATHADTFIEFVVEPNPVASVFDGHDRMRCLTGELATTWSGQAAASAWFEVEALGPRSFGTQGQLTIQVPHAPPLTRNFEAFLGNADYDATTTDARWQLRWRIDRIANLDVYDGAFQVNDGNNGVATEREIVVERASFNGL